MKERLDQLDDQQKAQLRELKGVSPIVTTKQRSHTLERPVRDTDQPTTRPPAFDFDSDLDLDSEGEVGGMGKGKEKVDTELEEDQELVAADL